MSSTYQTTEQSNTSEVQLDTPEQDTPDLTSVTVQVGAQQSVAPAADQGLCSCGGGTLGRLLHSSVIRYLLAAAIAGLLIYLLERAFGASVPQELRKALLEGIKEALHQAAPGAGRLSSPALSSPPTNLGE
jgi:predicted lipid-binding transport protein (Tim44 family)